MPNYHFEAKEIVKSVFEIKYKIKVKTSETAFLKEKAVKIKVILTAFFLFFFQKCLFRLPIGIKKTFL